MEPDERCSLVFTDDGPPRLTAMAITAPRSTSRIAPSPPWKLAEAPRTADLSGAALGSRGAAEGMLMAGALNALTTRHRTAVALRTKDGVEIVLYDHAKPRGSFSGGSLRFGECCK